MPHLQSQLRHSMSQELSHQQSQASTSPVPSVEVQHPQTSGHLRPRLSIFLDQYIMEFSTCLGFTSVVSHSPKRENNHLPLFVYWESTYLFAGGYVTNKFKRVWNLQSTPSNGSHGHHGHGGHGPDSAAATAASLGLGIFCCCHFSTCNSGWWFEPL